MLKLPFTEDQFTGVDKEIWKEVVQSIEGLSFEEVKSKYLDLLKTEPSTVEEEQSLLIIRTFYKYILHSNDPDGGIWSEKHQVNFPYCAGHISGDKVEPIGLLGQALNRIKGVTASSGTLYEGQTYNGGLILWRVTFDSIAVLQHFLWAGCFRYFPLEHNNDWLLKLDSSDPDYTDNSGIHCYLQYQDLNADRVKWEKDLKAFTEGVERYAEVQNDLEKKFNNK